MKKLLFLTPIIAFLLLTACDKNQFKSEDHVIQDTKVDIQENYLGSYHKGNFVWGGAMNLAWTEFNEKILHEKLKLNAKDKIALEMVNKLNNPIFAKNDLDEKSYYVKSGYGQKTVNLINKESREKFPKKSFGDLNIKLDSNEIISYAYFLKEVEYETKFEEKNVSFENKKVEGFYAKRGNQKENIKIIKYKNDDKFIISLKLKDKDDELILTKGYNMNNPQIAVDEINKNNKPQLPTIGKLDRFEIPKLHLDCHRDYIELIGKYLANQDFENYFITHMFESIKFDMDEAGARVENAATVVTEIASMARPAKYKSFILDKPYWVIMKRKNSQNPYFILGVNNTELMGEK